MKRIYLLIPVVLSLIVVTATAVATNKPGGSPSSQPPFGPPDMSSANAPEYIPAGGPDGGPVICKNGKELLVKTRRVPPKVASPGVPIAFAAREAEDYVPRCGKGTNPHLNAQFVPASQDPLRAAPASEEPLGERP